MRMRNNNEKIYPRKYDTVYLNGVVWFKISNPRSLLQGDFVVSSKKLWLHFKITLFKIFMSMELSMNDCCYISRSTVLLTMHSKEWWLNFLPFSLNRTLQLHTEEKCSRSVFCDFES